MDTGITVFAPNRFLSAGNYKIAYLLHGLSGDSATWIDYSMLPDFAKSGNTIYVMPEVARSFYTDMKHGLEYFTYIVDELPRICKSVFNISSKREDTAILGASMGGYGALKAALSRPEQYGMCGAFASGCLFLKEALDDQRENGTKQEFIERYGKKLIKDFISVFGENLEWRPEYEVLELAQKTASGPHKPVIYITCGKNDPFYLHHARFDKEMKRLDLNFTYEEWQGQHDFPFFNLSLKKAIDRFGL